MKRRVVITGIGTVNPTGNSVAESWDSIKNGKIGIGEITCFDTEGYKVKVAAEVKDFDPTGKVDKRELRHTARFTLLALTAKSLFAKTALILFNSLIPFIYPVSPDNI